MKLLSYILVKSEQLTLRRMRPGTRRFGHRQIEAALPMTMICSRMNNGGIPGHLTSSSYHRAFASDSKKSPFDTVEKKGGKASKRRKFVPPKAAVELTPKARKFFKLLLENPPRPDIVGMCVTDVDRLVWTIVWSCRERNLF